MTRKNKKPSGRIFPGFIVTILGLVVVVLALSFWQSSGRVFKSSSPPVSSITTKPVAFEVTTEDETKDVSEAHKTFIDPENTITFDYGADFSVSKQNLGPNRPEEGWDFN